MKKLAAIILTFSYIIGFSLDAAASPIISGISTNDISIDTSFDGAKILLFGAKDDFGDVVIAVRGPKKDFMITRKERSFGVWHNGKRVKIDDSYSYYAFFSTLKDHKSNKRILSELQLSKENLQFVTDSKVSAADKNEFQIKLVDHLEKEQLYLDDENSIDFLNETLFKVMLHFPKNIARGVYHVEIYLINDNHLSSFQTIPIYVHQVGMSARVLDFAYQESLLYGILAVFLALVFGWLANHLFVRFFSK